MNGSIVPVIRIDIPSIPWPTVRWPVVSYISVYHSYTAKSVWYDVHFVADP